MKHKPGRSTLKAPRMQRVLKCLKQGGWWRGYELDQIAHVTNSAGIISSLRFEGMKIQKRPVAGKNFCEWKLVK